MMGHNPESSTAEDQRDSNPSSEVREANVPLVQRPVFVFGCPRSGTTYLGEVLNRHSRVYVSNELRVMAFVNEVLRVHASNRHLIHNDELRGDFVAQLRADLTSTVERFFRRKACEAKRLPADSQDFVWGDKTPGYADPVFAAGCLETINDLFPQARFIHIWRDPRAVVRSLTAKRWYTLGDAADLWARTVLAARDFARRVPADRFLELSYADLCEQGESQTQRLTAFLGVEMEPGLRAFVRQEATQRTPFSDPVSGSEHLGRDDVASGCGLNAAELASLADLLGPELGSPDAILAFYEKRKAAQTRGGAGASAPRPAAAQAVADGGGPGSTPPTPSPSDKATPSTTHPTAQPTVQPIAQHAASGPDQFSPPGALPHEDAAFARAALRLPHTRDAIDEAAFRPVDDASLVGRLDCRIVGVRLEVDGELAAPDAPATVEEGDHVRLVGRVHALKNFRDVIVGFTAYDTLGKPVAVGNIVQSGLGTGMLRAGIRQVSIDFTWPRLPAGAYSLTLGIGEGVDANNHTVQCWAEKVFLVEQVDAEGVLAAPGPGSSSPSGQGASLASGGVLNHPLDSFDLS
ncbi:MAG: sulfotransferase [Planctomycetota bacterium]|nr:sulfotransferase [Planctomycetota bacterium]